ncbi:hypothetical protein Hamer_G024357, partial [Homarus americanus]
CPSLILDLSWTGYHPKKKKVVVFRHIKTVLAEPDSTILKETKDQEEQRESSEPTQSLQKRPHLFSSTPPATKGEGCVPFDVDHLVYWRKSPPKMHPLKHLAREISGCTATSAPSDRVFSVA